MGLACPQVGLGAGVGLDALSQAGQMRLIFASFVQARACLDRSKVLRSKRLHFRRRFCFGSATGNPWLDHARGARGLARIDGPLALHATHAERTPCQLCTAQGHVTRLHAHRKGKLPGARLEIVAHGLSPYINLLPDHLSTVYVGRCEQADEDAHDACSACYETCCTRR